MHSLHPPARKGNDIAPKRGNVISFNRHLPIIDASRAFDSLTHQMVMQKHRAGTLPEGVIEALLVGVGIEP